MKALLHEFLVSWHVWAFFGGLLLAAVSLVTLAAWLQRADYQRTLDEVALRSVEKIDQRQRQIIANQVKIQKAVENIDGRVKAVEDAY
jgi:hypothetical protein